MASQRERTAPALREILPPRVSGIASAIGHHKLATASAIALLLTALATISTVYQPRASQRDAANLRSSSGAGDTSDVFVPPTPPENTPDTKITSPDSEPIEEAKAAFCKKVENCVPGKEDLDAVFSCVTGHEIMAEEEATRFALDTIGCLPEEEQEQALRDLAQM